MLERRLGFNLEPTFRCNLGCEMCPRFASEDPHLDMSMEVYQRIAEAMHYAHNVDFTGWGEPLLHKRIYDMIAMAKERGCETSMTSNGTAINARNAQRLIEAGMDRLTVSIDGLTPETYDTIRVGASLEKVAANLRGLSERVSKSGSGLELAIAFTIQELNASQIPDVPAWADPVGAKVVHLKHLNVPSTQEDWKLSLLKYRLGHNEAPANGHAEAVPDRLPVLATGESEERGAEALTARSRTLWDRLTGRKDADPLTRAEADLHKAVDKGKKLGLRVEVHSELPIKPTLTPRHCLAAPLDAVYFSYQGKVSPCCHFGHHVSRFFEGRFYPPSALFYGDIRQSSLEEIWNSPAFTGFRAGFESKDYPKACQSCYLLYGK